MERKGKNHVRPIIIEKDRKKEYNNIRNRKREITQTNRDRNTAKMDRQTDKGRNIE